MAGLPDTITLGALATFGVNRSFSSALDKPRQVPTIDEAQTSVNGVGFRRDASPVQSASQSLRVDAQFASRCQHWDKDHLIQSDTPCCSKTKRPPRGRCLPQDGPSAVR